MGNVTITIHKITYTITCPPGDEHHVRQLGYELNKRVDALAVQCPDADDATLLIMTCLMILDENNSRPPKRPRKPRESLSEQDLSQLKDTLTRLTLRLKNN